MRARGKCRGNCDSMKIVTTREAAARGLAVLSLSLPLVWECQVKIYTMMTSQKDP